MPAPRSSAGGGLEKQRLSEKRRNPFLALFYYQRLQAFGLVNAQGLASLAKSLFPRVSISENVTFREVVDYISSIESEKPILLTLDEYPYLENREFIDSFIQKNLMRPNKKAVPTSRSLSLARMLMLC